MALKTDYWLQKELDMGMFRFIDDHGKLQSFDLSNGAGRFAYAQFKYPNGIPLDKLDFTRYI